jgi:hypothetical protein
MSRFKASGIHLILSILIALVMLVLVFGIWYPSGYYKLLGVDGIYFILMGVDVCLGPLLTLAVYKAGKKGLKFDLAVIAIVQFAALIYGANVVFKTRPVFSVLQSDVFKVATAADITDKSLAQAAKPEWRKFPLTGPIVVAALAPTDPKVREEVILAGGDYYSLPKLYVEYDSQRAVALKNGQPLSALRGVSAESDQVLEQFIATSKRPESDFVWLPIVYGFSDAMTVILDAKNADIVDIIDIDKP